MAPQADKSYVPRDRRGHFKKKTITAETRRLLAGRHGCKPGSTALVKCAYCEFIGEIQWFLGSTRKNSYGWVSFGALEMDHVVAEFKGGASTEENLVLSCQPCNRSKSTKERVANA